MWNYVIFNHDFYFIFYSFIIFSFFGWIWETSKKSIQKKTFVNRGFLTGPIIPIYGFGGTIVYLLLFSIKENWGLVFLLGAVIATVLEYVTAVIMESVFHAKWWDYSDYRIHFQGRISLIASLFWGVLSVVDLYVFVPIVKAIVDWIPRTVGEVLGVFIIVIGTIDFVVTVVYALQLSRIIDSLMELREELATYLVNTALIEKTEEWKEHISSLSINTIREKSIGLVNDLTKRFQLRVVNETPDEEEQEKLVTRFRQELELRLKNFFFKYRQNTEKGNLIHKRLLRAFPDIKLKRRTELLEDIRERWNRRKSN